MDRGRSDDGGEELLPVPPTRLFERLASVRGYIWDPAQQPLHSVNILLYVHILPLANL